MKADDAVHLGRQPLVVRGDEGRGAFAAHQREQLGEHLSAARTRCAGRIVRRASWAAMVGFSPGVCEPGVCGARVSAPRYPDDAVERRGREWRSAAPARRVPARGLHQVHGAQRPLPSVSHLEVLGCPPVPW